MLKQAEQLHAIILLHIIVLNAFRRAIRILLRGVLELEVETYLFEKCLI